MKRRQRRPVLTIDKPQSNYYVEHIQSKCKPMSNIQPVQNEAENPLANLLCQYNSDSDTEDPKKDVQKLDDQVNDFLKEIQLIAPERSTKSTKDPNLTTKATSQSVQYSNQQTSWQECYDESTGYPYYWHVETNEVTWYMPEELRLIKKQSEVGSVIKPPVQGPHWVDFSSIAYRQSQTNIPEGMIPQDVVARNRNRFVNHEKSKKSNSETKSEVKSESPVKDDDSDDGRIEMITSFGSDGSDSEDENNSSDEKKSLSPVWESGNSNPVPHLKSNEIGPVFCPTGKQSPPRNLSRPYKLDLANSANISNSTSQSKQFDENKVVESDNKSSTIQGEKESSENKSKKDMINSTAPKLDINVSLVPGYDGDDSDVEEEIGPKPEIKPLFPISQDEDYINTLKDIPSILAKSSSNVQSSDQENDSSGDIRDTKSDHEKTDEKESKTDDDKSKTNIFLEDIQVCGKAFQRKKRIAFDVTSAKVKQNSACYDNISQDDNSDLTSNGTTSLSVEDGDVGMPNQSCTEVQKEHEETREETEQSVSVKPEEKLNSKDETSDSEAPAEQKAASNPAEERTNWELNNLSQVITEKLKFLSEGRESVSAVQIMQIQLQTLSTAWWAGSLDGVYFQKWLTYTNHELERLEQDAAPTGWLCQWDRLHKRYYYYNTFTGTSQWTYPDTGIAGGTEEMELCTTPPPPESEELSETGSPGAKKPKEKQAEEVDDSKADDENKAEGRPAELEAPSPPQISNPSPPPPPKIFAEDLKKDKRKREKSDDKSFDVKRKRTEKDKITISDANQTVNALESLTYTQATVSPQTSIIATRANMEPLPPGVDLPDTSYEAATLKGIIYNAASPHANNALYGPSITEPTIPLLSHPPGLLQEQFVHYQAYHQHLHNQTAAIAVANKHGGQGAIQFMLGYVPIYTNNKIIAKPPIKASKESLGSALDSFYNDIARIERTETERAAQNQETTTVEQTPVLSAEETKLPEAEPESVPSDTTTKEKKKKKPRISISKKHKEMSTMVAKWQRVQKNLEDTV